MNTHERFLLKLQGTEDIKNLWLIFLLELKNVLKIPVCVDLDKNKDRNQNQGKTN